VAQFIPLSDAKARLSEVVRTVRRTGQAVVISVDGEPAVRMSPVTTAQTTLTATDIATADALFEALLCMPRAPGTFDAVELVQDGRR
jgi:prevent-host-death family protein